MHQTFEKSSLAMTHKLDDMIELPKSQSKKTYKEELECEIVMVKIPKCMSWLDACDEPIGDLDMMEDKVDNPSPQNPGDGVRINPDGVARKPRLMDFTLGIVVLVCDLQVIFNEKKLESRKAHLLEDKQIPSVGVFDEVFLALGWHLEEIQVTWAHLEKKRTRLRLYTKSLKKLCIQSVETASRVSSDNIRTFEVTASEI
ncbi:hypothetical protein Tco_0488488 [Tanacetum coccineum]